jgi:carbonyl reductase 1
MKNRTALVTGANRGIGLQVARELAARGLRVLAAARDPGDGAYARAIGAAPVRLDVADPSTIAAVARDLGPDGLDVLVNNAGTSMQGFDANVARTTLDVNFAGAMRVTDAMLPHLREGARVVMVSSGMGHLSCLSRELQARFAAHDLDRRALVALMDTFVRDVSEGTHAAKGWPTSAYSVSKVGMNALTRVLARELAGDPRKILLNAASPGWVRTRMGGRGAPRSVEEGARTIVWLALLPAGGPSGGFFEDERAIPF